MSASGFSSMGNNLPTNNDGLDEDEGYPGIAHDFEKCEADLTQAVQMYTDSARERDKALADLAAAQSYATTLAVSMHKQHYAEDAPNWQPLPDLVGLLTQIDNMYAGLRNDLAAAQAEVAQTKSFVAALQGLHAGDVETLKAERDALREKANALLHQIDIVDYVDSEGHVLKNNIAVLTLMKVLTNA